MGHKTDSLQQSERNRFLTRNAPDRFLERLRLKQNSLIFVISV